MKIIVIAACLMLLFVVVPVQAQTLTDTQKAEIEKIVKEQITALCSTFDTLDVESAFKLWSRDKLIGEVTAGRIDTSIDAMIKRWKSSNANVLRRKNDIQEIKVNVISPDVAFATSKNLVRVELKNGNVNNSNWVGTFLWVKESSGWKLAFYGQSSSAIQ